MRDTEAGDIVPSWVSKPSDWESISGRESHTCGVTEYLPACSVINVHFPLQHGRTSLLHCLPVFVLMCLSSMTSHDCIEVL
jgi:hypothetical protein